MRWPRPCSAIAVTMQPMPTASANRDNPTTATTNAMVPTRKSGTATMWMSRLARD